MSKESSEIINVLEKEWNSQLRPLTERLKSGDPEAIAEFVTQYQQRVRSVAMDVLMDADLAVKATSATFRNAIVQLQNGVETRQVEPWLLWIARNEALALTQAASSKQRIKTENKEAAPKPVRAGTEASGRTGRAAAEATGNQSSIDARIQSFLGSDPSQRMKDQTAQRPTGYAETAKPGYRVADGQDDQRDDLSAVQRAEAEESFANRAGNRPTAQDDAQWKVKNRERKRLQGLETEDSIPDEPANVRRNGEHPPEKPKATLGDVLLTGGMAAVALLLLWIVLGLLRNNGVLNLPDLGYGWFNENVFYLF